MSVMLSSSLSERHTWRELPMPFWRALNWADGLLRLFAVAGNFERRRSKAALPGRPDLAVFFLDPQSSL